MMNTIDVTTSSRCNYARTLTLLCHGRRYRTYRVPFNLHAAAPASGVGTAGTSVLPGQTSDQRSPR